MTMDRFASILHDFWPHLLTALDVVIAVTAAGHAILHKRDSRAAVGWAGIIIVFPFCGSLLYLLFGINRVHRDASVIRGKRGRLRASRHVKSCSAGQLEDILPARVRHLAALDRAVNMITRRPLFQGNTVQPLVNGDEAYPAMLDAIAQARASISLATYIFDNDRNGAVFVEALGKAVKRGVEVRVLVDALGARYSRPRIVKPLRAAGIQAALFLPASVPWRAKYMNLRNHRKILVVDGLVGFTGGMNLRDDHLLQQRTKFPTQDTHFRLTGPVVAQLQEVFAEDWAFTTGEVLKGKTWFPALEPTGTVIARGIMDGPDEDFDRIVRVILSALACARSCVRIMTPYFLPSPVLMSALNTAALRGVHIDIILPEKNNLPWVGWAMMGQLWQVLEWGCHVWLAPPPFDHTKLMIVDDEWCLFGSANWDARSLRLNFEFNVETYCPDLARSLASLFERKKALARRIKLEEVDSRPFPIKFRDAFARLMAPYL